VNSHIIANSTHLDVPQRGVALLACESQARPCAARAATASARLSVRGWMAARGWDASFSSSIRSATARIVASFTNVKGQLLGDSHLAEVP